MAGNRPEVSTAIFTDAVYADKLLSLALRLGPHSPDNVLRVARVFMAIDANCIAASRDATQGHVSKSHCRPAEVRDPITGIPLQVGSCGWHPTSRSQEVNEDNARHGIYLARMSSIDPTGDTSTKIVLVKFTAKYNEVAHRLLADHDPPLAPILSSTVCAS